jgi:hypothetical protein
MLPNLRQLLPGRGTLLAHAASCQCQDPVQNPARAFTREQHSALAILLDDSGFASDRLRDQLFRAPLERRDIDSATVSYAAAQGRCVKTAYRFNRYRLMLLAASLCRFRVWRHSALGPSLPESFPDCCLLEQRENLGGAIGSVGGAEVIGAVVRFQKRLCFGRF